MFQSDAFVDQNSIILRVRGIFVLSLVSVFVSLVGEVCRWVCVVRVCICISIMHYEEGADRNRAPTLSIINVVSSTALGCRGVK